jgi:predicted TIM-barrel fold metal-dependent hydrolase
MIKSNRRTFLSSLPVGAYGALTLEGAPDTAPGRIIDTNVYLSYWPGRQMGQGPTPELVAFLRSHGVVEAWAGSFDALLHKDIGGVNARLAEECSKHARDFLRPFGAVNPLLPDWEEDLRRCHEEFRTPGIRLHPNYQGYSLDHPAFARLLAMAAERKLVVQIVAWMEDERTQHPLLRVPLVDLTRLAPVLAKVPGVRVVILNGFISVRLGQKVLAGLQAHRQVVFDLAMQEQLAGLKVLIDAVGLDRVVFGSYSPMFYFEAATLKLRESALTAEQSGPILFGNARRVLGRA